MLKRKSRALFLALLLFAGFFAVLFQLFSLRFDSGDIYPPYSSLRSDPLGTRAIYESLDRLPDVSTDRWLDPGSKMPQLEPGRKSAFLLLGLPHRGVSFLSKPDVEAIEEYVRNGGHVVLAFRSIAGVAWYDRMKDEHEAERAERAKQQGRERTQKKSDDDSEEDEEPRTEKKKRRSWEKGVDEHEEMVVSLPKRWNFTFNEASLPMNPEGTPEFVQASLKDSTNGLNASLPWHSSLQFTKLSSDWRTIYEWKNEAVVVRRDWGKGQLTMCSDSYLFSNEALKLHRETGFLTWLVGDAQKVYFDESHLGVAQDPGVASLVRKYRLHGAVLALLLLAALFIWRNAVSLVPPEEDVQTAVAYVEGRDAGSGFLNLLFRSIPPKNLIPTAFAEWKRSFRATSGTRAVKIQEMELVMKQSAESNPVNIYRQMVRIWKRKG